MQIPTKEIILKSFSGSDIKITYKTFFSEYDHEQVDVVILKRSQIKPTEEGKIKTTVDPKADMNALWREKQNAEMDLLITKIEGIEVEGDSIAVFLKKVVSRTEFNKLVIILDEIVNPITPEQKKRLLKNSSLPSVTKTKIENSPQNSESPS